MLSDIKFLLEKVTDPLDMAVVLIAGTAGFVVDAGLNAVGFLSPGAVGISAASGALGLKKSAEAALNQRRARSLKKQENTEANTRAKAQMERANRLLDVLMEHESISLAIMLRGEIDMRNRDIITSNEFDEAINKIIEAFRESQIERYR